MEAGHANDVLIYHTKIAAPMSRPKVPFMASSRAVHPPLLPPRYTWPILQLFLKSSLFLILSKGFSVQTQPTYQLKPRHRLPMLGLRSREITTVFPPWKLQKEDARYILHDMLAANLNSNETFLAKSLIKTGPTVPPRPMALSTSPSGQMSPSSMPNPQHPPP